MGTVVLAAYYTSVAVLLLRDPLTRGVISEFAVQAGRASKWAVSEAARTVARCVAMAAVRGGKRCADSLRRSPGGIASAERASEVGG